MILYHELSFQISPYSFPYNRPTQNMSAIIRRAEYMDIVHNWKPNAVIN